MTIVRLLNARLHHEKGEILKRVNLTVRNGEFVFLVGPSGAGKTSILKLIYMAERPTGGQVMVGKYSSLQMKPKDIPYLRRQLGVVFQDFKLLEDRDVYDNLAFALQVTGAKQKDLKRRVLRTLANVGLSHKRYKMPHELSGGEQQRVAIARALINEPVILLADEPTGNLDPVTAGDIMNLLEKINERGTAVLMATHNYTLVEQMGKRVVRVEGGVTLG